MGRTHEQTFLQRRPTHGQQAHEKMLRITSGKYKSKPQWDPTSHQWEWGKLARQETANVGEDVEKGEPFCTLVGMWTGAATLENCVEVPQRVKNRTALWLSNCTAGDLPQRYRCSEMPGHLHPIFIAAMSTIAKLWKEPRCPSKDEWIKKMWSMYTMEYYSAIRNDKYPPSASTWMELEGIMLSEISQRRTNIVCSHSFGEYKK